jgi:hypothetical protein
VILAVAPALPLHAAGKYVAGAYIVLVVLLVVYLGIMTVRTSRTNRELAELRQDLAERRASEGLDRAGLGAGTRPAGRVGSGKPGSRPEGEPEPEGEPVL